MIKNTTILLISLMLLGCGAEQDTAESVDLAPAIDAPVDMVLEAPAPEPNMEMMQQTVQEEVNDKLMIDCLNQIMDLQERLYTAESDGNSKEFSYLVYKLEQLEQRCR